MRIELIDCIRGLFHPHEVVAMKARAFETGCDDLGQYEGDPDRQVPPLTPASIPTRDVTQPLH